MTIDPMPKPSISESMPMVVEEREKEELVEKNNELKEEEGNTQ
jgi:hypothetical protein